VRLAFEGVKFLAEKDRAFLFGIREDCEKVLAVLLDLLLDQEFLDELDSNKLMS
jgi:hypothetical protein